MKVTITGTPKRLCSLFNLTSPEGGALAFAFDVSPQGEGNTFIEVLLLYGYLCCIRYLEIQRPKTAVKLRIKDLLNRMTLDEKIGQMIQIDKSVASADVMQKYFIGSILSGGGSVPAKQASPEMDPELIKKIGAATALEVQATGINYAFAPCIAGCRDPRWGHCFESYSKDPAIVRQMTELIPGLQGDISASSRKGVPFVGGKEKVVACAKHFVGDGGTTKGINENNTVISPHG
ncbi:hypothetical protein QVD17_17419 [Tagetes erecta]|uniref:Glycoside hydrolase family 3 N-terminal domain-containing protein n=1 Tax=Tagetes erecta TaxID=13708 RepID=A0AAD8P1H6_TARER|nr:hypothetical protein QVD17_17419 [Tagetes erecta]